MKDYICFGCDLECQFENSIDIGNNGCGLYEDMVLYEMIPTKLEDIL